MRTEKRVLAAASRHKAYTLPDAGELFLFVSPAGSKNWRFECCKGERKNASSSDVIRPSV